MNCPRCEHILQDNYSAASCPFCGNDLPKGFPIEQTWVRPTEPSATKERKWKLSFWLVFLGSPCGAVCVLRNIFSNGAWLLALSCLAVGGIICGWLLSRIFRGRLGVQIRFTLLVLGAYLVLVFLLLMLLGIAAHGIYSGGL
jgi:hypothetical protein